MYLYSQYSIIFCFPEVTSTTYMNPVCEVLPDATGTRFVGYRTVLVHTAVDKTQPKQSKPAQWPLPKQSLLGSSSKQDTGKLNYNISQDGVHMLQEPERILQSGENCCSRYSSTCIAPNSNQILKHINPSCLVACPEGYNNLANKQPTPVPVAR